MTYVTADIHGNLRRFESVMNQIDLQPEDVLYILGDVIDRFPDGIKILRRIMKMPNAVMLLGNHEYMMLDAVGVPADSGMKRKENIWEKSLWFGNSGLATYEYLKHIRKDIRAEIFEYLLACPINLEIEVNGQKYRLMHGAPATPYFENLRYDISVAQESVWGRWAERDADLEGCIGIFGHTPTECYQDCNPLRIWYSPNGQKIGIDCGSGYPEAAQRTPDDPAIGRLACLRLDDMKEFYSEEDGVENGSN